MISYLELVSKVIDLNDEEYESFEKYVVKRFPDLFEFIKKLENSKQILELAAQDYYNVLNKEFSIVLPEDAIAATSLFWVLHSRDFFLDSKEFLKTTKISEDNFMLAHRQILAAYDFKDKPIDVKEFISGICRLRLYPVRFLESEIIKNIEHAALKLIDMIIEQKIINVYYKLIVANTCIYIAAEVNDIKLDKEVFCRIHGDEIHEFEELYRIITEYFGFDNLKNLLTILNK